jgi:hypothetical protein
MSGMKLRIARHTERSDDIIGIYRDRAGLPEIDGFQAYEPKTAYSLRFLGPGRVSSSRPEAVITHLLLTPNL